MNLRACKAAFPQTIPVLTGYLFLGMAFGLLMESKGFGIGWTFLSSFLVYAGSLQFVSITLLTATFDPVSALILALVINARHLFYGISMLEKYKGAGKLKPFLIFWLSDETFSVNCSASIPDGIDKFSFYFWVSALDYIYWITGSLAGATVGSLITFNTAGIDFALTALFTVIFVSQWKEQKHHAGALIGIFASLACLVLFGKDQFVIPALISIPLLLFLFKSKIEPKEEADGE